VTVTIAVPTYNRAATLQRALDSVIAQTHEDLEIVVSDNASSDATPELLADVARRDGRVRVVRQASNRGMVGNLNAVLAEARGDHVMLLADDDWMAPRCVELCLAGLDARPDAAAAVPGVTYMGGDEAVEAGQPAPLVAESSARRVRAYFAAVGRDHGNTWLYGLARRDLVQSLPPMRNVLAFDWIRVAELAFSGPLVMTTERVVFRELGGTSETTARNVRESGLPTLQARLPHLAIAREVLAEIGWRSPVFAPLGARRLTLAARCAASVPLRNLPHVAFHLAPAPLQRRWHERRR
jgi:GT2 family glycosyltransferase